MSSKKGKSKGNKPSGEKLNKKDIEIEVKFIVIQLIDIIQNLQAKI